MNNSSPKNRGRDKLQQNVKPETDNKFKAGLPTVGNTRTVPYQYQIPVYDQPNTVNHDRNAQKSKATYSAQHQASHISGQQNFNTNNPSPLNTPNMRMAGYPYCNAVPLHNVSPRMINNEQNISMENAGPTNNIQYSCPCCNPPPPMPPCKDDLWDLQFCRWWGWNWIRKREEMVNQKKAEVKTKRTTEPEVKERENKPRRRRKQNDFFSWCNKLFKKRATQKRSLKDEEKQQLQELYDTPCSSITFNNCPCPMDNWECRSLNLKGQYECYCGSRRQTSMSTVVVQNKTRHQRCKQNMRKHQSWVCEKTDSSSSDELYPCVCVCPQRGKSSAEESIEYLSMRMAQVKSDSGDNEKCWTSRNQKETKKTALSCVCSPCKTQKEQETNICCPCMIKLVYKQPCNCRRNPSPCRSLPVCRPLPPRKFPQLRRFPTSCRYPQPIPQCRKIPKRKYVDCNCQKKTEYIVSSMCAQPRKKVIILKKPKQIHCCYCYCCNCCCSCNKNDVSAEKPNIPKSKSEISAEKPKTSKSEISAEQPKASKLNSKITAEKLGTSNLKSEKNLKETADNRVSSKSMIENRNVTQCFGDFIQDKVYNTEQFSVTKALQEGLYTSPVTGRFYSLNPEIFTVNEMLPQSNLPQPLDVSEKVFNINPVESPVADEEHNVLLAAVCEAIMSSRSSTKERYCQTSTFPKIQLSPNNNWRGRGNHTGATIDNCPRNCEQRIPQGSSDDARFSRDKPQNSTPATKLNEFICKNYTVSQPRVSKPFYYKRLLSPSNVKVPLPSFEVSENFTFNDTTLSKQKSVSNMSGRSRYSITNGKHGPIRQRCPIKTVESQNYTTQQLYNLNLNESKQKQLQISKNIPVLEEKYSMKSLNTNYSLEAFSTTNIHETYNEETTPFDHSLQDYYAERLTTPSNPPTIQKSSTGNASRDSGDMFTSEDISVLMKKNLAKNLTDTLITFNSPKNWIKPPKLSGISMTALFSAVGDIKEVTKNSGCNNKIRYNNLNTAQMKKQRFYNSLFSSDYPDYSESFPYKFSPIPNKQSTARNPTIYPLLQELPSDNTQATQTSMTKAAEAVSKERSHKEMECKCNNLLCRNQSEKTVVYANLIQEYDSKPKPVQAVCSQATETSNTVPFNALQTSCSKPVRVVCSQATETSNTMPFHALQTSCSKATETHYDILPITPQPGCSKATDSNPKLTQSGALKTTKASNTVYSQAEFGNSKLTATSNVIDSKKQSDSSKITQASSIDFKLHQPDSSNVTTASDVADSQLQLANNLKLNDTRTCVSSKLNQDGSLKTIVSGVGQSKPTQTNQSKTIESMSIYPKSSDIANSKFTKNSNHGQMKQDTASTLFTNECNSEKEIGCRYFNDASCEDLYRKCRIPSFKNVDSSQYHFEKTIQQNSEGICVYVEHEPQDFNFFTNTDDSFEKLERSLTVVNRIPERSFSNLSLVSRNVPFQDTATTSKYSRSSKIENQTSLPKSFISASPTPIYMNTSTSPIKIKYAKTRPRDRSPSDNLVKEKVPKRESPFSMFCTPVTSKNVNVAPPSNNEITETGSLSRPNRQVVLAKPKELKAREKRWRY